MPSFEKAIEDSLPDTDHIEKLENKIEIKEKECRKKVKVKRIRTQLKLEYSSPEHWQNISFEDKKMLHFLFDGNDHNDTRYGTCVMKKGCRNSPEIDYFLYGRLTGLRTTKGDNNIDWSPEEDNNGYDGGL